MECVGEKLKNYALSENDRIKKDLFGRSAFNRYYYAAFLITREMLGAIEPKWKKTPHRAIPKLLKDAVCKPVVKRLEQSAKKDLLTNGELSALRSKLTKATTELANLLHQANNVRLIADYEPENHIVVNNKIIILSFCTLTSANTWANRAKAHCKDIRKVWKDSGLV
ncbi:hypothetical protein JYT87_01910 [Nitrospira defluvii]|nr:hypothetical protein [Nitrospira defluvii]